MTTQTHAPSARPTTRPARLRRLVAVGSLAPLLALAACSGDEPITSQGRVATGAATAASTGEPPTASESTTTATPSTTAKPTATTIPLKAEIKDPELGHVIKPLRLVRNVPWPAGNPVSEASYEIIAMEVQVTAGSRYSADIQPIWLTLGTGDPEPVVGTAQFGKLMGEPLVRATRGKTVKGWVYYKVVREEVGELVLMFNRPDYKVSTTGKSIPAKIFEAKLD